MLGTVSKIPATDNVIPCDKKKATIMSNDWLGLCATITQKYL